MYKYVVLNGDVYVKDEPKESAFVQLFEFYILLKRRIKRVWGR